IGQSVINVTSGGRGRLSTFTAGVTLLILLAALGPFVGEIPMPALVAVMVMVSIGTFSWNSIPNLRRHPLQSSVVMVTTVVVVVATHDLSLGVLAGVLLSGIFFTHKVQQLFGVEPVYSEDGSTVTYKLSGEIFFASVHRMVETMEFDETVPNVVIDTSRAHFWDISGVGALDKIVARLRGEGREVRVVGLNQASADIVDKFALEDKTGFELGIVPH
ncbi:MAG: SulP family inorganic anion transporter, partial [Novosphingobium sp.]|nr:SulP family inorganic anion transporter [Novosphingobium sp.]